MGFTLGFGLGWFWGILTTLGAIGVGCALKDRSQEILRREWHTGMDGLLRKLSIAERKRRNNARVLDAVREVIQNRQDVAWKN